MLPDTQNRDININNSAKGVGVMVVVVVVVVGVVEDGVGKERNCYFKSEYK